MGSKGQAEGWQAGATLPPSRGCWREAVPTAMSCQPRASRRAGGGCRRREQRGPARSAARLRPARRTVPAKARCWRGCCPSARLLPARVVGLLHNTARLFPRTLLGPEAPSLTAGAAAPAQRSSPFCQASCHGQRGSRALARPPDGLSQARGGSSPWHGPGRVLSWCGRPGRMLGAGGGVWGALLGLLIAV